MLVVKEIIGTGRDQAAEECTARLSVPLGGTEATLSEFKRGLLEGLNALWALHDEMEGHLIRLERNFTDKELKELLARDD